MNIKARFLLIGTVLAISGIAIKGTGNANANLPENLSTQTNHTSISSELNNIDSIAQSRFILSICLITFSTETIFSVIV